MDQTQLLLFGMKTTTREFFTVQNKRLAATPGLYAWALFFSLDQVPASDRIDGQRASSGPRNKKTTGAPPVIFARIFYEPLSASARRFSVLGMFTL